LPIFGLLAVTLSVLMSNAVQLTAFWYFSEKVYYIGYSWKLFFVYMLISISICLLVYYFDINFFLKLSAVLTFMSFAILFFKSQILQTINSLKLSKQ